MQEETVQPQKSLEELLAEAQAKIEQQRDTMMRAVADAENARKRAQGEAAAARKYALERFAEGLLPVVDSLEAVQKGYRLHDRVLRPALVTVAKARVENEGGNPISDTGLD